MGRMEMPEISYKRGLDNNYMIIKGDENTIEEWKNNYKIKMLAENRIHHILKLEMKMCGGIYDYYYEISGKQPIGRIYDHRTIKTEDLISIISSLDEAYEKAYEYMLPPDHFIIDPKLMYMDVETSGIDFIYYPEYEMQMSEALMELAEYILDKVDHQDSNAVMLAYQFYKIVRTGNFIRKDLMKILEGYLSKNTGINDISALSKQGEQSGKGQVLSQCNRINDNYSISQSNQINDKFPINHSNNLEDNNYDNEMENDYSDLNDTKQNNKKNKFSLTNLLSIGKKKKAEPLFELEEEDDDYEYTNNELRYSDTSDVLDESDQEVYGKTMILIPEDDVASHVLIQKGKTKDIVHELKSFPLSLGKVSDVADIIIKDPSVSKLHAEIYMDQDKIYIKDCNSTNGTYVNGLQLDAEESIDLEPGDEITLGKLKFEYR